MKQSKIHKISDFIFMMLPFILLFASLWENQTVFNLSTLETSLSAFRSFDFGLSDYLITNLFNNSDNVYLLFMFDIMLYYLYWRLIDLVISTFGFFVDFIKCLLDKWRNF